MKKYTIVILVGALIIVGLFALKYSLKDNVQTVSNSNTPTNTTTEQVEDNIPTPNPNLKVNEITQTTAPMNSGGTREARIKAGAKFGYIRTMKVFANGTATITFDEAQWLDGNEADKAAKEDSGCNTSQNEQCSIANGFTPNGFYIRNQTKTTTTFTTSKDAIVRIIDMSDPEIGVGVRNITIENLANLISETEAGETPRWLTFKNGQVVDIEEQYLP